MFGDYSCRRVSLLCKRYAINLYKHKIYQTYMYNKFGIVVVTKYLNPAQQVFVLDLIMAFILDLNFLMKINETLIRSKTKTLTKEMVLDKILS